ncbi:MAG: site-specific DNA-methyltransferase [Candidatus Bathyarchaeota archaeon]|nr:site-specific DNA-methyltransferase [Candidatus Bathyarchaeota archaeon]
MTVREQEGLHHFFPKQGKPPLSSFAQFIDKQKEIIRRLNDVDYISRPEFASFVNSSQSKNVPIHRWFKYREGYSPNLVHAFFDATEKSVLDPFCGSGTTLVCAKQKGLNSVGMDINPLSAFISRVKTYQFTLKDLAILKKLSKEIFNVNVKPDDPPKLKIIGKVFPADILDYLLRLRVRIKSVAEGKIQDTLLLGWLAILESVSNTKKEGNGIKYRSTRRTKNGYVHIPDSVWQHEYYGKDRIGFVRKKFQNKLQTILSDIENHCISHPVVSTKIFDGDSAQISSMLDEEKFSLAIFSPPYANCFDYFEIFKVELWMGGFIKGYEDIRKLKKKSIGSLWQVSPSEKFDFEELSEILNLFEGRKLWDKKIVSMIEGYFTKMEVVLKQIYEMLMPNRKCAIVVGNSAYSNVLIPTDLLLSKIGREIGFKKTKLIIARHLTTSSQQKKRLERLKKYLRESIIVLEK